MSRNKSWYEVQNHSAPAAADIYLYDEIGFYGVTAKDFARDANALQSKTINLHLNSPGGDVWEGMAIYNVLKNHSATVNTIVDGIAASAASYIAQAGDRITMAKNATMMIHEPHGMAVGDAANMTKMAEELNLMGDQIAGIYADRAGGTTEDWRTAMRDETWYGAQAAVDAKLADEVAAQSPKNVAGRIFNLATAAHDPHSVVSQFQKLPDWALPPVPVARPVAHKGQSAYVTHHTASGAVDSARICVALARARNLSIDINDRAEAIRHLEAHARCEGVRIAA